ncbi:beta-propeller fold lactonase family protein [Streptomyces cucumeris]|uniref:beta-propeller fold lactonase family protein n=1 Tax=Streptomyces cucumeris TaxID=2962890 RepID=UPI003D759A57
MVTTYRVREDGAALEPVVDVPSGGAGPRDLHVDGAWMHVTNERSDTVTTFVIGTEGIPAPTGAPPARAVTGVRRTRLTPAAGCCPSLISRGRWRSRSASR